MGVSSVTSAFSLGRQTAKGTAGTKFFTTLATVSGLNVAFDREDEIIEHPGVSTNSRATTKRSQSELLGYKVPFKSTFRLRPRFMGAALLAAGFQVTTATTAAVLPATQPHYTHTFTMANSDAFLWYTAMERHGSGAEQFERRAVDSRLKTLSINADTRQIECALTGLGLVEGNAATSGLTRNDEATAKMLPSIGSVTATVGGTSLFSRPRGITFELTNEFDEEDIALFETARADLPINAAGIQGSIQGLDVSFDTYKRLIRGGTTGTAPSLTALTGALSWEYRSPANIPNAAVPYRLAVSFPSVEFRMPDEAIEANGSDQIRFDIEYMMIDDNTTPITITLVNDVANYNA